MAHARSGEAVALLQAILIAQVSWIDLEEELRGALERERERGEGAGFLSSSSRQDGLES